MNRYSKFFTILSITALALSPFDIRAAEVSSSAAPSAVHIRPVRMGTPGVLPDTAVDRNNCLKNIFEAQVTTLNNGSTLPVQLAGGARLLFSVEDSGGLFGYFHRHFMAEKGKSIKNFLNLSTSNAGKCTYKTNSLNGGSPEEAFTLTVAAQ